MIRKFETFDAERVMQLWLRGNEDAHDFIYKEYWRSNYEEVSREIAKAEVYVCEINGELQGFIGLVDGYIAGIFVDERCRSRGIGKELLDHAKRIYDALTLNVYEKNQRAVSFYQREGFSLLSKGVDQGTGETEYTVGWKKKSKQKS